MGERQYDAYIRMYWIMLCIYVTWSKLTTETLDSKFGGLKCQLASLPMYAYTSSGANLFKQLVRSSGTDAWKTEMNITGVNARPNFWFKLSWQICMDHTKQCTGQPELLWLYQYTRVHIIGTGSISDNRHTSGLESVLDPVRTRPVTQNWKSPAFKLEYLTRWPSS